MSTTPAPLYTLSRENAFQHRTFQDRAREARVTALQDRALESKGLEKELEWRPLFETFKDLKKYKTTIADQDLFEKANGKLDPSTVYRLENEYEYKKNSQTLSARAIQANRQQGILAPPPHMNPVSKLQTELNAYQEAYQDYRKLIMGGSSEWAKFIQEQQPVRDKFSIEELSRRQDKAKKVFARAAKKAAFELFRKELISDNAFDWEFFTRRHRPLREKFSTEELSRRHDEAKKAIEAAKKTAFEEEMEAFRMAHTPTSETFVQEHQPIRERFSTKELSKRRRNAKKALKAAQQAPKNESPLVKSLKAPLKTILKHIPKG